MEGRLLHSKDNQGKTERKDGRKEGRQEGRKAGKHAYTHTHTQTKGGCQEGEAALYRPLRLV